MFLLGKKDPEILSGVGWISDYETGAPLVPPASVVTPVCAWELDGNGPDPAVTNQGPNFQGFGDCVIAGAVNSLRTWNVLVSESDPIPDANGAVTQYLALSGGQDTGLSETSTLQTWRSTGLFGGEKISAWAPVQHTNITAIQNAIAYYGVAYFGVQLPDSAQNQFNPGGQSTWSVVPGAQIEGGHCIIGISYNDAGIQIVTWGQIVTCTWQWIAEYVDESYAIIPNQFIEAGKGPSLDLAALQADLAGA